MELRSAIEVETQAGFAELCAIEKTAEELSMVCKTEDTPENTIERDDGWKGFRIQGVLDIPVDDILETVHHFRAIDYVIDNAESVLSEETIKNYYYRGLAEWRNEKGRLLDTCLDGQDTFVKIMDMLDIEI